MVKRPCIISERGHTTSRFGTGVKAEANKCIMRLTYPRADQVIAVSQGIRDDLIKNFAVPETKIRVIYNPVNPDRIRKQSLEPSAIKVTTPYIVGVGRLVATKKFDLLIEAYRLSGVSEKLVILGDGSCRQDLERLVSRYRLSTRVILPGHVQNPYPIIQRARLFVSSSIAEGFPNALIEAMALGCPVVATDCDTGPIEILTGQMGPRSTEVTLGEYGILVPVNSIDVLAQAIRLGCREDMRALYSQRGQQRARHFGVRDSVDQYWALIAPYIRAT